MHCPSPCPPVGVHDLADLGHEGSSVGEVTLAQQDDVQELDLMYQNKLRKAPSPARQCRPGVRSVGQPASLQARCTQTTAIPHAPHDPSWPPGSPTPSLPHQVQPPVAREVPHTAVDRVGHEEGAGVRLVLLTAQVGAPGGQGAWGAGGGGRGTGCRLGAVHRCPCRVGVVRALGRRAVRRRSTHHNHRRGLRAMGEDAPLGLGGQLAYHPACHVSCIG